ncbi:MAG: FkbM family methyltransferase [Bacteroidales bacterium]|nr:FkbM family methyltransferase [Lachnoclostridium sp.]MCM1383960.1 FkbM family methyltransferase [Lachnoclostridium sp.]MCM1464669.1 FkbM family methyltransferase [Bacteroidales bacterium]
MNHTKELLLKLKAAILDGRLSVENIPIADIKQCVAMEIKANKCTFTKERYSEVTESFQTLCEGIADIEWNQSRILLWMDALILCVDMISPMIYILANSEYWRYKYRDRMDDPEIREIIDYIEKEQKIEVFNYAFSREYDALPVEIVLDEDSQMRYVPHKGKKLFFPRNWDEQRIANYYCSIAREQDVRSPHCYAGTAIGAVEEGDVVVDAGAAEGIFALDVIDRAKQVYLVESDKEWIEALEQTFREEKEKIQIVCGFLDCVHQEGHVSIDGLFEQEEINFIKMDIEGAEKSALQGAVKTLQRSKNIRCAICTYHCKEDEEWIRNMLEKYDFETETSKGYMWIDDSMESYLNAELRRGIIFGRKV